MKIAYGFMLHDDSGQFQRPYNTLYNGSDIFAIHADQRCNEATFNAFRDIAAPSRKLTYTRLGKSLTSHLVHTGV